VVGEGAEEAAVAAPRGEKEKQASAESVNPRPTRSLLAQSGIKHWRSPGRNRAVAPPLSDKREAPEELAAKEQTTVAAHQAHATLLTTLSPPPPQHAQRFPLLCLKVPNLGLTRKTRREKEKQASAGFATPPPISAPSARCGLRQWRLLRRKRAVAPPPDRQTGSGGGGSSRGRANYQGLSSSSRGPSLSTLASTTTPARREAHSPVPEVEDQWEESEN
jgi:hypothetical protein